MSETTRECKDCGGVFVLETDFYKEKRSAGGYQLRCKTCMEARKKRWARENPKKKKAQVDRWRKKYPEKWRKLHAKSQAAYRKRTKARKLSEDTEE